MRTERRLLQALLRFADGAALGDCIRPGVHWAGQRPILHVWARPYAALGGDYVAVEQALQLAIANPEALISELNQHLRVEAFGPALNPPRKCSRPTIGQGVPVLVVEGTVQQWAYAVLALAYFTKVGDTDSLLNRIARCQACEQFFLLPTARPSKACSPKCRIRLRRAA